MKNCILTITGSSKAPPRFLPRCLFQSRQALEQALCHGAITSILVNDAAQCKMQTLFTHFIVTFSYSLVWYTWADWERLLDWAALHGVNIQLAWVGYEKIYLEAFRDLGLTDDEILPFFSGAAFQAWNRFGNIKGVWGGQDQLPLAWIEQQAALQQRIVARMVELGITPVLPAFPGFVPEAFKRIRPDAMLERAAQWGGFPDENSRTLFLNPLDETYAHLQQLFIQKQIEAFGNVTNIYTLDQFNEINPVSGETDYLRNVSVNTYAGLESANPAAIWLMQGWLFLQGAAFWTQERVEAYLGGPDGKESMLLLDLFSEALPLWEQTKGYYGRPWIWCQVHDYGGVQSLYGRVTNVTEGPVRARAESESMSGVGLGMEAYEGNEIAYVVLLDQAWGNSPINTTAYFSEWTTNRYAGKVVVPKSLYKAWQLLREHAYDVKTNEVPNVGLSIYQLVPALNGLVNRTGIFPAPTKLPYDPAIMQYIWKLFHNAVTEQPSLYENAAFHLDFVDVTRQVMGNAYIGYYVTLVSAFNSSSGGNATQVSKAGKKMLSLLNDIDAVLSTDQHFTLGKWLDAAKEWGSLTNASDAMAFFARNQVTIWGVGATEGLNDYAAKAWSGLTRSYYGKRWRVFVDALVDAAEADVPLDEETLRIEIRKFESMWQSRGYDNGSCGGTPKLHETIDVLAKKWPDVFAS
jgi:alpha-N-acetylglucosaminidase